MSNAVQMVELWRGDILESCHRGHAVVCDASGAVIESWGDPDAAIFPRSSCKMIQALPLVESGAAAAFGLTPAHLALACASHNGESMHTDRVGAWLGALGLSDGDLRCGPQPPGRWADQKAMVHAGATPCQMHNNCSGKHSGFLTLAQHLGAGPEYIEIDHPVQAAVRAAFEEVTGQPSPGYGIDGCSAPNFATTVHGLARAMAAFAAPSGDARGRAMTQLVDAMTSHPELVAGTGRACTELMQALGGRVALKTGAEGVFVAILPDHGLGVALKIEDGATRASECALAAILIKLGALDPQHPATLKRWNAPVRNRRGIDAAYIRPSGVFS